MNAHSFARTRVFRQSLMALACAAAASPVLAQSAASPAAAASDVQRVEVTGSRLKQIDTEGVSPIQVITRAEIARTGATTVREMLDSLSPSDDNGNRIAWTFGGEPTTGREKRWLTLYARHDEAWKALKAERSRR